MVSERSNPAHLEESDETLFARLRELLVACGIDVAAVVLARESSPYRRDVHDALELPEGWDAWAWAQMDETLTSNPSIRSSKSGLSAVITTDGANSTAVAATMASTVRSRFLRRTLSARARSASARIATT